MLDTKDFELIVSVLEKEEQTEEIKREITKLNLLIKANKNKEFYESEMMNIQDELRKIYDLEHKKGE